MTVMDRYVTWTFFKIFAICLICLTGLFVVVDAFSNLEEFVELGQRAKGIIAAFLGYYAPRALQIFDRTGALLSLTAAIGTLAWMQRHNELTAIEAGGISKSRVVRPILWSALVLVILGIANRELLIPQYRERLSRNAQSWDGSQPQPISPVQDLVNEVWLLSGKITPADGKIDQPEFRLPASCETIGTSIRAETALFVPACAEHPAGFQLFDVKHPTNADEQPSVIADNKPIVLTPRDYSWLGRGELFIVCSISIADVAYGPNLRRFSSLKQQISDLWNSSVWTSNRQRVEVHGRLVRPAVDYAILLIGLPIVLSRRDRNIFLSLGVCLMVVLVIQSLIIVCHWLGSYRFIASAALSAWLPVAALLPLGYALYVRLEQ